ncbi:hypothetical protein ACF0H5_020891 [Mactra antiquata]
MPILTMRIKKISLSVLAVVAIVVYLLFFVVVIICVFTSNVKELDETDNSASQSFCLQINDGRQLSCGSPVTLINDLKNEVLGNNYKLIKDHDKYDMIEWINEDPGTRKSKTNESFSRLKPIAKLLGENMECNNCSYGPNVTLTWCSGNKLVNREGLERNRLQYYRGRLVVPVHGLYIAYSYIEFFEPCAENGTSKFENLTFPIEHAMYKYSVTDNEDVKIASSKQSKKKTRNKVPEIVYGSYISTVLRLFAGDEVSVKTNFTDFTRTGTENFFGLVLYQ